MRFHTSECGILIATLACALAPSCARCQGAASRAFPAAVSASDTVEVIREIDDPSTGDRWLLVRDWNRPGGPGRLLLLAGSPRATEAATAPRNSAGSAGQVSALAAPVIHAGDPLVVEEDTPMVEARLAATALGPAACGAAFEARLEIGGKVVRVRALGSGRASLEPGLELGLAPDLEVEP